MNIHNELVGRARELAPLVSQHAREIELDGRIPDSLIDQFCSAGFMDILVPKYYGGKEMGYRTFAGVISEIAPFCTSTAWVLSFYIGHSYIHSLFPKASQDEVFADRSYSLTPGTIAPNFTLTPEGDGYIANGVSSWNSGSSRSDWYLCCGMIKREGQPPEVRAFFVPTGKAKYIENWDVAGMRGTSSSDMELKDVFVPAYHTVLVSDLLEGTSPGGKLHPNPKYSMPLFPFVLGEVVPVMVGAYRGAANTYKGIIQDRFVTFSAAKAASRQTAQMRIGHGMAGAEIAEDLLAAYINMLENSTPETLRKTEVRAAIRARVGMILDHCTSGINHLIKGAGAAAFRNDCPLQRFFRDINMIRVHGLLETETSLETYGRVLLGLPSEVPL